MDPVSGAGDDVGPGLRELGQQRVAVGVGHIGRVAAGNKLRRVRLGRDGFPADDMRILVPQHRHVEAPVAVDE